MRFRIVSSVVLLVSLLLSTSCAVVPPRTNPATHVYQGQVTGFVLDQMGTGATILLKNTTMDGKTPWYGGRSKVRVDGTNPLVEVVVVGSQVAISCTDSADYFSGAICQITDVGPAK